MTREATLCQNILNALRIFARISKFPCFHETKQTQFEVGRFFYNLTEFVFEYFRDSRRILATFAKFCLNTIRFSQHDLTVRVSYRYLNPKHVTLRALKFPFISHTCFFNTTKLYKPLLLFAVFFALTRSPNICTKTDINWEKGEDFVKTFYVKKLARLWLAVATLCRARTGSTFRDKNTHVSLQNIQVFGWG